MAATINEFEQGRIKHLLFKSKLRAILLGATIDESPVLSEHECPFGQWMQAYLLKTCANFPELKELERVHTDMHRVARSVVKQYHAGAEDNPEEQTRIERLSDKVMELLSVLEIKCQEQNS